DHVAVVADGQVVAAHARSYRRGEKVLDPLHFLVILERKPAALDHAPVYRDWQLPPVFAELRRSVGARPGPRSGGRQYIRVLQLLAHHPMSRVEQAIGVCQARGDPEAPAIAAAADRLARDDPVSPGPATAAAAVTVPRPDLSRFNRRLAHYPEGDDADERSDTPAAEGQPEATQAADGVGRVREAGP